MYLQYGSVVLRVIDLIRYDRENIYTPDKTDLLSVRTTIGVSATYAYGGDPAILPSVIRLSQNTQFVLGTADASRDNTAAIASAKLRGLDPDKAAPVDDSPTMEDEVPTNQRVWFAGPQTDAELRYRLMLPRQKLILWVYDRQTGEPRRWLESPRPGFETDVGTGPLPIGHPVIAAAGEPSTVAVYFEVTTDMSPSPVGADRAVLSHRWQTTHTTNDAYYLTRVIRGEIVFNGEHVNSGLFNPDDVRNQFIHPIPIGFVRGLPEISQSSDGLTMRYTITDTDPTIVFDPGDSGAVQMDIAERITYNVPWASDRFGDPKTPPKIEPRPK